MLRKLLPVFAGAALISAASLPAKAADITYDPRVFKYEPPVKKIPGGWYLRGYIGMTNQHFRGLTSPEIEAAPNHVWLDPGGFASAPLFGGGVGYQLNDWLRGDVTVEYRGKAAFRALDSHDDGFNDYSAKKSELLFLANAYADLGEYHGITPYVGAGIGTSRNTISHFNDVNIATNGGGFSATNSVWQFAWALHAGLGYKVSDRATIDLGYSFTHLGNARTGTLQNYDPAEPDFEPITFRRLYSHDFKLGLRYAFN
jgi:opacity protein-like surface antigen